MRKILLTIVLAFIVLISQAQWSVIGSSTDIGNTNTGNVGIGVGSQNPLAKLHLIGPALSSTNNDKVSLLRIENGLGGNTSLLDIFSWRYTTGSDWLSATTRIQQTIDNVGMGFLDFNPPYNIYGLGLGTKGVTRLVINSAGDVGIGTNSPDQKLQVNGNIKVTAVSDKAYAMQAFTSGGANDNIGIALHDGTSAASPYLWIAKTGDSWGGPTDKMVVASCKNAGTTKDLWIFANDNAAPSAPNILVQANTGGVSIGTTEIPAGYKLAVGGNIIAEKVKVKLQPWADYVFEPTYKLPTLKEVEVFIKANKHLPDVPSAKEVERSGLDLGNSQAVLLRKIEELTLYLLQQDKQQSKQAEDLNNLNQQLFRQQEEIEILKKQVQELLNKGK